MAFLLLFSKDTRFHRQVNIDPCCNDRPVRDRSLETAMLGGDDLEPVCYRVMFAPDAPRFDPLTKPAWIHHFQLPFHIFNM
jgi:hypothetical protein